MQVTATQKRNKAHIKVTHLKTSTVSMVRLRPSIDSESPTILMTLEPHQSETKHT